jgi:6-phosphogluconolactonase
VSRKSLHRTTDAAVEWLSSCIACLLEDAVRQSGAGWLVVSGGQSPAALYTHLQGASLPWHNITVSLADERLVPILHAERNEVMVRRTLLQGPASLARWLPIADDTGDPEKSLTLAAGNLALQACDPDVMVLGMGLDGHTLSWFPEAPETPVLMSREGPVVGLCTPSEAPRQRITLGWPLVVRCKHVFLWLGTEEKTRYYQSLEAAHEDALPVIRLTRALGDAMTIVGVSTGNSH